MRDLPSADKRAHAIQRQFGDELALASRMFDFWMEQSDDIWINDPDLPQLTLYLTRLLDIQTCRQFRSVVSLSKIGEGLSASIVARSLYETVLKSFFLLKPDFSIAVVPKKEKKSGKVQPNKWRAAKPSEKNRTSQQTLSREIRATLVYAHSLFADAKELTALAAEYPALSEGFSQRAAEIENDIGPEWAFILRNDPTTYSGLSVFDLASTLDNWCVKWYETVYRSQSREVHAATLMWNGQIAPKSEEFTANWFSPDNAVGNAIYCGISLFNFYLVALQNFARIGDDATVEIEEFWQELQKIYPESSGNA
jgi:hypothetical protein